VADQIKGCDSLTVSFTLDSARNLNEYSSVEWFFGDGSTVLDTLTTKHTYVEPGLYNVRCRLDGGRDIEENDFISVSTTPYADFSFKNISLDDLEYKYQFEPRHFKPLAGIDLNYTWKFPDGSEVYDSIAVYTFKEEGIYDISLQIIDENGCLGFITDSIPVSKNLMIPSVFSPNGDGLNDFFMVTTSEEENWIFSVFSRSGLQVFSSNSPQIVWDGHTLGDKEAPEGVYYYVIVNAKDSDESYRGYLYLFR